MSHIESKVRILTHHMKSSHRKTLASNKKEKIKEMILNKNQKSQRGIPSTEFYRSRIATYKPHPDHHKR